ncbi:universal stress protein [Candidatus Woesearchaeota archaeon]|nr:universal stress protein [Candidatus Woesearchaeota archaeon]
MAIRKILVATDGSVFSRRAASFAIEIAKAVNAEIIALHVIEVKRPKMLEAGSIEKTKAKQAELCFKDFEAEAKNAEVQFKTKMLVSRSTPQTIIDEVEVQNPDILAMGSHGLTGLKKLLLGSVSTEVLKKSTVPVLIVK